MGQPLFFWSKLEGIQLSTIIGIAIILILFSSSSVIEKRLRTIEKQNEQMIEILEE